MCFWEQNQGICTRTMCHRKLGVSSRVEGVGSSFNVQDLEQGPCLVDLRGELITPAP